MFPSIGDSSRNTSYAAPSPPEGRSRFSSSPNAMAEDEDDILAALGIPPMKPKTGGKPPPPRPPPPGKSYSLPVFHAGSQACEAVFIPPPLQPCEVRWFYLETGKFWQPFAGCDSLRLEQYLLELMGWGLEGGEGSKYTHVSVMGDLYSVHIEERLMEPIYWPCKEKWKVMRGCWFEVVGDKWYPFMEADYDIIENEHVQRRWRERAKKDAALQAWAVSPAKSASTTTTSTTSTTPSQPSSSSSSSSSSLSSSVATPSLSASTVSSSSSSSSSAMPPSGDTLEDGSIVVNKLAMKKYDLVWLANGDIHKMKKELSSQLWNKMGQKFGKGALFGGTKVVRGYKEYASGEDRLPPIGHVVFVTHGIGQTMDASCIEQSTKDFREACFKVAKGSCFADMWSEKRVEFIPVEWRTGLSLDEGLVNRITPNSLKMLRSLVNDCVMDVFYYFSPKFGPEILNGLKTALQNQYNEFMLRNPRFLSNGGTVSVIAHSLGSVMLYDILREKCDLDPGIRASVRSAAAASYSSSAESAGVEPADVESPFTERRGEGRVQGVAPLDFGMEDGDGEGEGLRSKESMREELMELKKKVAYLEHQLVLKTPPKPLSFSIDHFFAFGSPTALFIAMKEYETLVNKYHRSAESFLPSCVCKRIHNVQHPSDPIAYRLEPLVHPYYAQVNPVKMSSAKSKISQDMVDLAHGPRSDSSLEEQQQTGTKSWWANQLQSVGTSLLSLATKKKVPAGASCESDQFQASEKMVDSDILLHPREKLKERLDFTIKESAIENSYFNSITAHHSYWTSADCAQYVLLQIYRYKSSSSS